MSASLATLACRDFVSTGTMISMKIHDESIEEIDEALAHLSDGIRHAGDFRKQHLLDLVDQMLDAKLGMNQ